MHLFERGGHVPLKDEEAQPARLSTASFEHTHDALQLENVLLQIRDFLPVISLLVMLKLNQPRSLLSG